MKFNWGTGIFIFYTLFAILLFYQVFRSTQYDHSLVVDNYYEKDLQYQSTLDKLKNSHKLDPPLVIHYYDILELVELEFPTHFENITGSVLFYRPSSMKEDLRLPIRINEMDHCMNIFIQTLQPGKWEIEVDWVGDGIPFLDRKVIMVPEYVPDKMLTNIEG